jgi:hypothetical protein
MAKLHQEVTLPLNADCTEFCPVIGNQDVLAVGTYQLNEATQQRDGCLLAYKVVTGPTGSHLSLIDQTSVSGIFDIKWQSQPAEQEGASLALALADGSVMLCCLRQCEAHTALQPVSSTSEDSTADRAEAPKAMMLSLAWSRQANLIAASTSAGDLCLVQVSVASTPCTWLL